MTELNKSLFESSVNSEGIEAEKKVKMVFDMFESSVNSEGIEAEIRKDHLV